jgi:hypothetical protein
VQPIAGTRCVQEVPYALRFLLTSLAA